MLRAYTFSCLQQRWAALTELMTTSSILLINLHENNKKRETFREGKADTLFQIAKGKLWYALRGQK